MESQSLEKDNDLEDLIQDCKALTQQNSELLQIIDNMNKSEGHESDEKLKKIESQHELATK